MGYWSNLIKINDDEIKINFETEEIETIENNFSLKNLPLIGDRIALLDQAHYTMVKTSFFNGVKLPSIAVWDSETDDIDVIKQFSFKDFENKL